MVELEPTGCKGNKGNIFFTAYLLVQMQQVEVRQKAELSDEPWQVEQCLRSVELWREVE